jgi:hypothetical protein
LQLRKTTLITMRYEIVLRIIYVVHTYITILHYNTLQYITTRGTNTDTNAETNTNNTQLYTMREMVLPEDETKIFDETLETRLEVSSEVLT